MIDRIVIDNFKSIKHADVKLQQVNLLIGPNNSGKSNFLKCIEHISMVGKEKKGFISELEMRNLNRESLPTAIQILTEKADVSISGSVSSFETDFDRLNNKTTFLGSGFASEIYKIVPDKIKMAFRLGKTPSALDKDGGNISALLENYLLKYRSVFNKISSQLYELTGYFNDIVIDHVSYNGSPIEENNAGEIYSKFGLVAKDSTVFWSQDLSEGVLYLLAFLCIINQVNPPKLFLIEEPEIGIHPRRIKEIIDLIKQLAVEKDIQVIMTTHSPLVVNLFADEPESIFVFDMKDGFTEIKNLLADIIEPTNKELQEKGIDTEKDYGISLGDQWVYGLLGGVPV